MALSLGSVMTGLYQDQRDVINGTPPDTAPDGAVAPETGWTGGEIAGDPSGFLAHGVGYDTIGGYPTPGGERDASSGIRNADLFGLGASIANPARARDGFGLQMPGTPEQAINAPRQGPILDQNGIVHLGFGPGIPLALIAIIAGFVFLTYHKGPVIA